MADNRPPTLDPRGRAEAALAAMSGADFPAEAERLLDAVGYASARRLRDQTGDPADFMSPSPPAPSKDALIAAARSIRLLFQVTDEEIAASAPQVRPGEFDGGVARSFLFIAAELGGSSYSRGDYAAFTREINKRFNIPAVVLYWTAAKRLTIAFVHRRPNKRDPNRDVVGSVSLIREINPADPHRAHLDILRDLSLAARLDWMASRKEPRNFDGLLAAWLDALDTRELNRQFYRELFAWFERACDEAQFPATGPKTLLPQEHVIRLITRLLFIWFIKEKGLVAPGLFVERQVASLLKDYDRDSGDSYYRAVLQNLFFATLNTEIAHRGFSGQTNQTHRDFSRYRYRDEMTAPDALRALFDQTPFINGGLFDCLDSEDASGNGGWRIDCFTDNPRQREGYSIPNRLFFGPRGVIPIFEKYKFTVEENTPVEQDVALDPELLGKAFENLLAANTPETQENARKQTGSFYTPRPVVDYMADEALTGALAQIVTPDDRDAKFWRERIAYLLDYGDAFEDARDIFTPTERSSIVDAIANLRVLDPAVGSGAFPMAILHKLTLALRRLDPDNLRWGSDFQRKLHLIQNAIYGVDVQTVACQIAKLRFFISLAIEQNPTADPSRNYGVQPLPNLETRFVAANTLVALQGKTEELPSRDVTRLRAELKANRERHFHAANRQEKLGFRRRDKELRKELAEALRAADFSPDAAKKVADWDPYDQNASVDWFDSAHMFGVTGGFNVVIGNPPYAKVEHQNNRTRELLQAEYSWSGDLYDYFIFRGYELTSPKGFLSYIANDSFVTFDSKQRIRDLILNNTLINLTRAPAQTFEASIYAAIFLLVKEKPEADYAYMSGFMNHPDYAYQPSGEVTYQAVLALPGKKLMIAGENDLLEKLLKLNATVADVVLVKNGGISSGNVRHRLFFRNNDGTRYRLLQGRQIRRFLLQWNSPNAQYYFVNVNYKPQPIRGIGRGGKISRRDEYWTYTESDHRQPERLLMRQTEDDLVVAYHSEELHGQFYTDNTLYTILPNKRNIEMKFMMALFNSKLLNYIYHAISQEKGKSQAQVKVNTVKLLPVVIPDTREERQPFIALVDKVLEAKASDANADTSALEDEIDGLVYDLYGLTEDEIAAVRSASA